MDLLQRLFGHGDRAGGYAAAVVAVADAEGAAGRVEDELYAFAKAVEQNPQLREALTDQALPIENRVALVRDVIGQQAHPATVSLISFIVESGRARDLGTIAEHAVSIAAERREHVVAEVRSAVPLERRAARAPGTGALAGHRAHGRGQGGRRPHRRRWRRRPRGRSGVRRLGREPSRRRETGTRELRQT